MSHADEIRAFLQDVKRDEARNASIAALNLLARVPPTDSADSAVPRARALASIASPIHIERIEPTPCVPNPDGLQPIREMSVQEFNRQFQSPIASDSARQRELNVKQSAWVEAHINPPRSPLEDAATDLSMAVADFYVLIDRAKTANDITAVWTMLQQMEQLVSACASAAGRKADAL